MIKATMKIQDGTLRGALCSEAGTLQGNVRGMGSLSGSLSMPVSFEIYKGAYEVTPEVQEQVLDTSDKRMTGDVVVHPIPFYEVSNEKNGTTVVIGGI